MTYRLRAATCVVVLAITLRPSAVVRAAPTTLPVPTWIVAGGGVDAIALSGTTAYLGGEFTYVGSNAAGFAAFDGATGAVDPAWSGLVGDGQALAPDGAGGWYVGGTFTAAGGAARLRLAHLRADGSVDPGWAPSVDGGTLPTVLAIAVAGSTVFVGGQFQTANGVARANFAAFDASGALTTFDPEPNGPVYAMTVVGGTLYVGGAFAVDTVAKRRSYLAAFDVATGALLDWNPDVDGQVRALAVSGSTIYAGGLFSNANGLTPRHRAAAFDLVAGGVTTWDPDLSDYVDALTTSGSTVYAGGVFKHVNGGTADRSFVAAFDDTLGAVQPFSASISQNGGDATVFSLAASGSTVYVGGNFTLPRRLVAALDGTTGAVASPTPDVFGGVVTALAVAGSRVFATGRFSSAGGVARNHLAAIDLTTGQATAWDPDVDGTVSALAVSGSTVYAGGSFATVNGGTPEAALAAFDATTGARTVSPSTNGSVDAFAFAGSTVYVGGNFDTVDGTAPRSLLASFGDGTDAVTGFGPGFELNAYQLGEHVRALAAEGPTVWLGGSFTQVSALVRHRLAAVQDVPGLVGVLTPFDADLDDEVTALLLSGPTLYAGGRFTTVRGGTPRHRLAAFDRTTGDATGWAPDLDGAVLAIALADPTMYAGGEFTAVGGVVRHRLAAIDTGTGEAMGWDPDLDGAVHAVAVSPATGVVAGGDFTTLPSGLRPQRGFAVFALPPGAPAAPTATAGDGAATVAFAAPAATGGAPVTSYTVAASPEGATATGVTTPLVVTGLSNGTTYTFTVTATNVAGVGPASPSSNPVTPGAGGGGCDAGPTFASIDCRLAALLARVGTAGQLDAVRSRLLRRLRQATMQDRHSEALCAEGRRRPGRKALRPALAALARFLDVLGSRRVRSVPPSLVSELRAAAGGIRSDMRTLERHLACPGSAPAV